MRRSVSKLGLACKALLVAGGLASSAAWAQEVSLKNLTVAKPFRQSVMLMGGDGQVSTGMEASDLSQLVKRVEEQNRALEDLRRSNETLSRKVDSQKSELDKLSRSVSKQSSDSSSDERKFDDLRRRIADVKSSVDDLRRRVK